MVKAKKKPAGKKQPKKKKKSRAILLWSSILIGLIALVTLGLVTGQKGSLGIDVSHHQGKIDWKAVALQGDIKYAFIKATEGKTVVDDKYRTNRDEARRQGIPVGAYHFFSTRSSGKEQFAHFQRIVGRDIDLKPVLDLEELGGKITDEAAYHREVTAWIDACHDYYGCYPIVYASPSFLKDHHLRKVIADCPYWIAWYARLPRFFTSHRRLLQTTHPNPPALLWQYTERGRHSGIKGYVDMNECWEVPSLKMKE